MIFKPLHYLLEFHYCSKLSSGRSLKIAVETHAPDMAFCNDQFFEPPTTAIFNNVFNSQRSASMIVDPGLEQMVQWLQGQAKKGSGLAKLS
jgi:hypothetical protein